jgi:hypothetical protein
MKEYPELAHFTPSDAATLTFKAWDQTFASAASRVDVSKDSAEAFFSSANLTATLSISPVEDRPVLTSTFAPLLASFLPNDPPSTAQVADLIFSGAQGANGLAVIGAAGTGTWAFSTDAGASWNPIGPVTAKAGRLLSVDTMLRFTPFPEFRGVASLSVKGWDGLTGSAGTLAAIVPTSMAFSKEIGRVAVAVNNAPTLAAATPTLPPVAEDVRNPAGSLVATLLGTNVGDADGATALQGMAVTTVAETTGGSWQFSTNGGKKWQGIGLVTDDWALLLRPTDKLRFLPNADVHGQFDLSFRAWDQTSGTPGGRADTTINGGSSAFSIGEATATASITAVNDAPRIATGYGKGKIHLPSSVPAAGPSVGIRVSDLLAAWVIDPDGDSLGLALIAVDSTKGSWEFSTEGLNWQTIGTLSTASALLLASTDWLRFSPSATFNGSVELKGRAWGGTKGTVGNRSAVGKLAGSLSPGDLDISMWVNTSPTLSAD